MKNNNTYICGLIVLIALVGIFFFVKRTPALAPMGETEVSSTTPTTSTVPSALPNLSGVASAESNPDAWAVFTDYLAKAKAHDKAGIAKLSYSVSASCSDPKMETECFAKMDAVYAVGVTLKKSDFVNILQDSKQEILSTKYVREDDETHISLSKSVLMFIKDAEGNPKLAALKPHEKWTVTITSTSSPAKLEAKLQNMVVDTDSDGLTDELENCVFPDNYVVFACSKTDPLKKDSNGDGYWDSFQNYIKE